jgi:hypothetical protein
LRRWRASKRKTGDPAPSRHELDRLAVGGLDLHFVIQVPRVFVVPDSPQENVPVWRHVARAVLSRLSDAPKRSMGCAGQHPSEVLRA